MLGTLSGSTVPDVSSIVCHFYRVNKDDIQWRGKRFSEEEGETWNSIIGPKKNLITSLQLNSSSSFKLLSTV